MIDPQDAQALDKAVSAALSHARSESIGLRGWRSSRLQWEVSSQAWDSNLACYVVGVSARPLDQPDAPQAQWEYQLDEEARILPGFPVIQSLPPWESGTAADSANNKGPRFSLGLLASVGALALVALLWLLTSPSPGLDASQLDDVATPKPVATLTPVPTPTEAPTLAPTGTPIPTATPVPTLVPTPTPNPTPTNPAPTEPPTPTIAPTIVPTPVPTVTPRPTLVPTATPRPVPPTRAPTVVPTPIRAPTVTPVPRHRLFINDIPVPGGNSLVFHAGPRLALSQPPKPDGRYKDDTTVVISISAPPGSQVTWGGVDSQNGPFVTILMNADRFVTVNIQTPAVTP